MVENLILTILGMLALPILEVEVGAAREVLLK
jgi:hypothetical protein